MITWIAMLQLRKPASFWRWYQQGYLQVERLTIFSQSVPTCYNSHTQSWPCTWPSDWLHVWQRKQGVWCNIWILMVQFYQMIVPSCSVYHIGNQLQNESKSHSERSDMTVFLQDIQQYSMYKFTRWHHKTSWVGPDHLDCHTWNTWPQHSPRPSPWSHSSLWYTETISEATRVRRQAEHRFKSLTVHLELYEAEC